MDPLSSVVRDFYLRKDAASINSLIEAALREWNIGHISDEALASHLHMIAKWLEED